MAWVDRRRRPCRRRDALPRNRRVGVCQ